MASAAQPAHHPARQLPRQRHPRPAPAGSNSPTATLPPPATTGPTSTSPATCASVRPQPTPSTNATEKVGSTYRITAFGITNTNYDIRYDPGTLTVTAALTQPSPSHTRPPAPQGRRLSTLSTD
ncbi:MAG: MBG domain-containing protein [Thermomicrobiales bacterium]